MRVLVTGGAGFIGSHLVKDMVAMGDHVVVFDNLRRGDRSRLRLDAEFFEGDIRNLDALRTAMRGAQWVYHLAAQSNVLGAISDTDYSFTSNVIGTYNMLVAARSADVER